MITVTQLANAIFAADNRVDHIDGEYVDGETDLVFHGTLNLASIVSHLSDPAAAPVVAPFTLDDVTRHTDALCAEYRQRMVDHQAWYTERVGQLSTAIEASEDLNHMEAGYIFLTKIRELTAPPETVTPEPVPVAEWIGWSGGDRPIPGDTLVTVRFADGTEADGYARDIQWEDPSPIMAYRVNA